MYENARCATVTVVDTASGGQVAAIETAMREAGYEAHVTRSRHPAQDEPHVGEALPWIVSITLATPIAAFFAAIGSEAGKDAYLAMKAWLNRVAAISHPAVYGHVELEDLEGTTLDLRPKALSDEAFAELAKIDWSRYRGRELIWAEEKKTWLDRDSFREQVTRPFLEREFGAAWVERHLDRHEGGC